MKKTILYIVLSVLFFPFSINAQETEKEIVTNNHITPGENQTWWGYFDGDISNAKGIGAGQYSEAGMIYDCAIFIPGNHSMGKGKTIKALRIYFASVQNINDVKVWMSKKLPNSADEADIQVKNIAFGDLTDGATYDDPENDFYFETPYTIDDDGVYVGYSFKMEDILSMQDMLPVVVSLDPSVAEQNANFVSTGFGWEDFAGKDGMGNLALRVLMEGEFKQDVVDASPAFDDVYCVKNEVAQIPVTLINMGGNGLDRLSYTASVDGVNSEEKELVLDSHVNGIGTKFKCVIPVAMDDITKVKDVEVRVTKVNGNDNTSSASTSKGKAFCLSELTTRKVVIEEYTGTWAEWAPRSYAGLEKAVQEYGSDVVITSAHFGEDDPMKCSSYDGMYPEYAPECNVSREVLGVDTYFGTSLENFWGMGEIIEKLRKEAPVAKLKSEGIINEEGTKVIANSYTTFLYNGDEADYALAYVLKTSGLKGTSSEWTQHNVLASFTEGEFDFDPIFSKWVNSSSEIKDMVYNDVPLAAKGLKEGVSGSVKLPVTDGEVQKNSVEFDLSEIAEKIQDKEELYVCVYLINRTDGHILNADSQKVVDIAHSSITEVNAQNSNDIIGRYSIDGMPLPAPVKGINILKYADGRKVKIVVN